jgi:hypothetical protein
MTARGAANAFSRVRDDGEGGNQPRVDDTVRRIYIEPAARTCSPRVLGTETQLVDC